MHVEQAVEDCLSFLRHEQGATDSARDRYGVQLRHFLNRLRGQRLSMPHPERFCAGRRPALVHRTEVLR